MIFEHLRFPVGQVILFIFEIDYEDFIIDLFYLLIRKSQSRQVVYSQSPTKKEVLDYIEFLLEKYQDKKKKRKFKFDWEGGLLDIKDEFTSVELQHNASKWR